MIVKGRDSKPNGMQSITQLLFATFVLNEFLQNPEFLRATCLDSTRIVKNVTLMVGQHEFVVDSVLASLGSCLVEATEEKHYYH